MKKRLRIGIQTIAVLGSLIGAGISQQSVASADTKAPTQVDSNTGFPSGTQQGLLISPETDNTRVRVTLSGGQSSMMTQSNLAAGSTYTSFLQKYGSTLVSIPHDSVDTSQLKDLVVTAQYGVVGTLKDSGDPVTAKVVMTGFIPSTHWNTMDLTKYPTGIEISNNLYSGFDTKGIQSLNFKLTFTDQKTGQDLSFNKDAYLSWNSLNPNATNEYGNGHAAESVAYLNNGGNNPVYVTNDTLVTQYKSPLNSSLTLTGGSYTETESWAAASAEKALGSKGFTRHSASYLLSGATQEFSINSFDPAQFSATPTLSRTNGQDFWFAPNTATVFKPTPATPVKKVLDADTKTDMDNQVVQDGQKLQYQIDQKVNNLGEDILERYTSMEWTDKLPAGFDYTGAYLVDSKGNKVTKESLQSDSKATGSDDSSKTNADSTTAGSAESNNTSSDAWAGTASFDKTTNTVTYKASSVFLTAMPMQGETYTLVINGTVASGGTALTLKNSGSVNIDGTSTDTNPVTDETKKPTDSTLTKEVTDTDGKTGTTGTVEAGKDYSYTLTAAISDKKSIRSLEIADPLEKVQTFESATVTDGDGKDITDQGKLDFDKATNTMSWKATSPSDFSGKTLKMKIKVKLAEDAELSPYKTDGKISIPNVGQLKVDDGTTPSNPTSVTLPQVKPTAYKAVQLTGDEPNGSDNGNSAETDKETSDSSSSDSSEPDSKSSESNSADADSSDTTATGKNDTDTKTVPDEDTTTS